MIFSRDSQLRWKRCFQEMKSFDTHSTANLPPQPMYKKNQAYF